MSLTHDEMARLLEAAHERRERSRRARGEEGYPATVEDVDEVVNEALRDVGLAYTDRRSDAWRYLWPMVAPASVRENAERDRRLLEGDLDYRAEERSVIEVPPGYEELADALDAALQQSAEGKGRERHANERPFEHQPIMEITREQGLGFPMGQARKKVGEAAGMLRREEPASARAELLGAIVYLAAAVLAIEEGMR